MELFKLILTGTLGALGFAFFFNIKPKHVPFAAIGGILLVYWAMKNDEKLFVVIVSWIVAILAFAMFAIIPVISNLL